ncbi:hypothetical protein H8E77_00665 [bacterium]|nr:hypothetical protein [bacterium]
MAYEILKRILSEMPFEQKQELVYSVILKSILSNMSVEQKQETIRELLNQMSKEERKQFIEQL